MRRARSRTRRAAGQTELVEDEAGIGVPHDDGFERDEPLRPRRSPPPCPGCSPSVSGFAAAARRRAVERFALTDWLERHAAIFAEVVGQEEGAPR